MGHSVNLKNAQAGGWMPGLLRLLGLLLLGIPATLGVLQWAYATPLFVPPAVTPTVTAVQGRVDLAPAPQGGMPGRYPKQFPVDLYNGEVRWSETDLVVASVGIPFQWTRTYSSRAQFDHGHGHNWDFNFNKRIVDVSAGGSPRTLSVMNGYGREDTYTETAAGSNTFHAVGLFDVIVDLGAGLYQQTAPDRTVCTYTIVSATDSRLASIADRSGNICVVTRNQFGNVSGVIDTQGRGYTVAFTDATASQRVASVTDFDGRQVVYTYEADGDLKTCRSPVVTGTPTGNDFAAGKTRLYAYTSGFADERLNHNLKRIIEPLYNVNDTPSLSTWAYQIIYQGETDPSEINFDRVHKIRIGHVAGGPLTNPNVDVGGFYILTYNVIGGGAPPAAVQKTICREPNDNFKDHYFDANRDLVKLGVRTNRNIRPGEPNSYITLLRYTSEHLLKRTLLPRGNEVEYLYDSANPQRRAQANLLEVRRQTNGVGGAATDLVTRFTWEPVFNQMRTMTDPRGFPAGTVPLDAGGHLDLTDPTVARFTTAFVFDYQESVATQTGRGVPASEQIPEGLGDLNGAIDFDEGNVVRVDFPTIQAPGHPNDGQVVQAVLTHNSQGQRLSYQDPDGDVTAYTYFPTNGIPGDPADREAYLATVIRDVGTLNLTTTYDRDPRGNVIGLIDPKGQRADYTFNALDQVVRRLSRETAPGSGIRYRADYLYNANDDLVETRTANLDESGQPYANTELVDTYTYNVLHLRVAQDLERTHNDDVTNAGTVRTEFLYDKNLNLVAVRSPLAVSGVDPMNLVTIQHDERDLVFRTIRGDNDVDPFNTPPLGSVIVTTNYNANGALVESIDAVRDAVNQDAPDSQFPGSAAGDVARLVYDGFDRLIQQVDPENNIYSRAYDFASNVIETKVDGPISHQPGAMVRTLLKATIEWDELNRTRRSLVGHFNSETGVFIGDAEATTVFEWAPDGKLLSVKDDNNVFTSATYDGADRMTMATDSLGNTLQYSYDANSNLTATTQNDWSVDAGQLPVPDTFSTTHTHDGLDRLIKTVSPAGDVWEFFFDSRSNLVRTSDPIRGTGHPTGPGNALRYDFDGLNRLVGTTRYLPPNGRGDTLNFDTNPTIRTQQIWDDNSRVVIRRDDSGHDTTFVHDHLNRVKRTMFADGTDRMTDFDDDSKPTRLTDQNGTIQDLVYDGRHLLTARAITIPVGSTVVGSTFESFGYDGASRVTRATTDSLQAPGVPRDRTFSYDSMHNILVDNQAGRVVTSAFDGVGNRTALVYPDSFDGAGNTLVGVPRQLDMAYDGLNRLRSITEAGQEQVGFDYRGPSRVETRYYGGRGNPKLRTDIQWDGKPRPIEITHTTGPSAVANPGALIEKYRYGWDRLDNQLFEARATQSDSGNVYGYDAIYRVTANLQNVALGGVPSGTEIQPETFGSPDRLDFAYDGVGSRTAVTETTAGTPSTDTYTQNPGDQEVNQYSRVVRRGVPRDMVWDNNGNLCGDGQRTYAYDFRNRLTRVTDQFTGTDIATFAYDALNARHTKVAGPGNTVEYVYDGGAVFAEYGGPVGAQNMARQYLRGSVYQMKDHTGATYWFTENINGSIGTLINDVGQEVESYSCTAFGETTVDFGTGTVNELRWLGGREDPETGLYYDGSSYYSAEFGFTLARSDGDTLGSFNSLSGNNPIGFGGIDGANRDAHDDWHWRPRGGPLLPPQPPPEPWLPLPPPIGPPPLPPLPPDTGGGGRKDTDPITDAMRAAVLAYLKQPPPDNPFGVGPGAAGWTVVNGERVRWIRAGEGVQLESEFGPNSSFDLLHSTGLLMGRIEGARPGEIADREASDAWQRALYEAGRPIASFNSMGAYLYGKRDADAEFARGNIGAGLAHAGMTGVVVVPGVGTLFRGGGNAVRWLTSLIGRRGGLAHRTRVMAIEVSLRSRDWSRVSGGSGRELGVRLTSGRLRFPDVVMESPGGRTVAFQVGRRTGGGLPVWRERAPLRDLRESGTFNHVWFVGY